MAKRTLAISTMRVRTKYGRGDAAVQKVSAFAPRRDLLTEFERFLADLEADPGRLRDEKVHTYARVTDWTRRGRSIVVEGAIGDFGEGKSKIIDVDTHETARENSPREASTVPLHAVLMVPQSGLTALYFTERAGSQSLGSPLRREFAKWWIGEFPKLSLDDEAVTESLAWLEKAELKSVTATIWGWSPDAADQGLVGSQAIGDLEHSIVPKGPAKALPQPFYKQLIETKVGRASLLGLPQGSEPDQIQVEVSRDGRRKTFDIDNPRTPTVFEHLADSGQDAFDMDQFWDHCKKVAQKDYFPAVGVEWEDSWNLDQAGAGDVGKQDGTT